MTSTGRRGITILDGAETAVAAACAAVSSATRSGFRRGLAQTPPRLSLRSSARAKSGSYRQARPSLPSPLPLSAPPAPSECLGNGARGYSTDRTLVRSATLEAAMAYPSGPHRPSLGDRNVRRAGDHWHSMEERR